MATGSVWKIDDKAWMKARKEAWKQVKANLNIMDFVVPRRSHKYHKEMFFTGYLDPIFRTGEITAKNLPDPFDGHIPFFTFWYYPEVDLQAMKELFMQEDISRLRGSKELLFSRFSPFDFVTDYGMLGGAGGVDGETLLPGNGLEENVGLSTKTKQ